MRATNFRGAPLPQPISSNVWRQLGWKSYDRANAFALAARIAPQDGLGQDEWNLVRP
jgi:hypothetical protein